MGEVPERLNGTVSKTVVGFVPTVGSNPTLSADSKFNQPFSKQRGFFLFYLLSFTKNIYHFLLKVDG
jgi:hypothetical protein